jgi:hypothetical protein
MLITKDAVSNSKRIVPRGAEGYLHHRYFNCNYGDATLPLDRFFGTFRDALFEKPSSKPAASAAGVK